MKKESWKVEKLAKEEAERVEIDKQEEALQRKLRIDAIKRANRILYEQTDKMKGLRSAQIYTDVLADRIEQIEEKKIKGEWVNAAGGEYHKIIMRDIAKAKKDEEEKAAKRKALLAENAVLQKEQLENLRKRYIARMDQEDEEGRLILAKSEQELVEDAEKAAERALQARLAAEEMGIANQNLKAMRLELRQQEAAEEVKRQADLRHKEEMAVARKRLEAKRFIERQNMRQKMIDRACEQLAAADNAHNEVMDKQAQAARDKEDADLAARQAKRDKAKADIELSRQQQLNRRRELRERDAKEEAERQRLYHEKVAAMDKAEAEKMLAAQQRAREQRECVEAQAMEKNILRDAERESKLREDAQTRAVLDEDDERFQRIAAGILAEAKAAGKNTVPIEKAMYAKGTTLMPASVGMRI